MKQLVKKIMSMLKDVSPRHRKDYYRIGKWMVSRRLLYRLAIVVCLICIIFILAMKPVGSLWGTGGYPAYRYSSLPLKFHSGKVEILGKSGYTAYIGQVKKGAAQGNGTLYRKNGSVAYQGKFEKNMYQGNGTLYRENGTKEYSGSFQKGKKQGKGKLYTENGDLIYNGRFRNDPILFDEMVGKKTEDAAKRYRGSMILYHMEDSMCTYMEEINALYSGSSEDDSMDGGWEITGVYVLKDRLVTAKGSIKKEKELTKWFGKAEYAGTTKVRPSDAAAVNSLKHADKLLGSSIAFETEKELSDVFQVTSYDKDYEVYIRTYIKDKFRYTFFSKDKDSDFVFYLIEPDQ